MRRLGLQVIPVLVTSAVLIVDGLSAGGEAKPLEAAGLAAESYANRELAGEKLWRDGEESANLLKAIALSDEPEAALRARKILRWFDLSISPDTPKEIVQMVESFLATNNATERNEIINSLIEKEAYAQLFKLPKHVTNERAAATLAARVSELARDLAEEHILEGEDEKALLVLEQTKEFKLGLLRWISFLSALDKGEEYWPQMTDKERIMLARWEGNVDLLRELVDSTHPIQTTLQLLDGQPVPFLEKRAQRADSSGVQARIAKAIWTGQADGKENLKQIDLLLSVLRNARGVEQADDVMVVLSQMGYSNEIIPEYESQFPREMFAYYSGTERIDEAFKVFGLEVGKPIPQDWIDNTLDKVGEQFEVENEGISAILNLAHFFSERGLKAEARQLLHALLEKIDTLNEKEVEKLLRTLCGSQSQVGYQGFPEFALEAAQKREEIEPQVFLSSLFFGKNGSSWIYQLLEDWEPDLSEWERARVVLALYGQEVDFSREAQHELIAKLEKKADEEASAMQWQTLNNIAEARGDLSLTERSIKALLNLEENASKWSLRLANFYFLDGRFKEAAQLNLSLFENDPERTSLLPRVIVSLELAGRKKEAAEKLKLLEKLALGDGAYLLDIGIIWGQVGYWDRQQELFQRAFMQLPAEGGSWVHLSRFVAEAAYRNRQWAQAAALYEVAVVTQVPDLRVNGSPDFFLKNRGFIDFARAMVAHESKDSVLREECLTRLASRSCTELFFADHIFSELRVAGLHEQAETIWKKVAPVYRQAMAYYPEGSSVHNTSAWVAARSACDLEDAAIWVDRALELSPHSSAYMDTKAEVLFSQGKREEALKWSEKGCQASETLDSLGQLRVQYRHFKNDSFPIEGLNKEEPGDSP